MRLAILSLVLLASPGLACEPGTVTGTVTHVRDGDTIELGAVAIRLDGLAAPEWKEPGGTITRPRPSPRVLSASERASTAILDLLSGVPSVP